MFREAIREVGHDGEPRAVMSARILEPFERRLGEPRLLARLPGSLAVLALVLTISQTLGSSRGRVPLAFTRSNFGRSSNGLLSNSLGTSRI